MNWYNITYVTEKYGIKMFCNVLANDKRHAINIANKRMEKIKAHVTDVKILIDCKYIKMEDD